MEKISEYVFNGFTATIIMPENPNGKWIWKTEFLYAFDDAERALLNDGYTRVYYRISDMYGSYRAVRLMHDFHLDLLNRFPLCKKAICSVSAGAGYTRLIMPCFIPNTSIKFISMLLCSICDPGHGQILPNSRRCLKSIA